MLIRVGYQIEFNLPCETAFLAMLNIHPSRSFDLLEPDEVEDAFVAANPGLTREGISVTCGGRRLDEVHICLSRTLQFRDCAELERRSCRRDRLVMPPMRG